MKAILDTNIYISFLLYPDHDRVPMRLLEAFAEQHFILCVCGEQLRELVSAVSSKPYLAKHIESKDLNTFATQLRLTSEFMDEIPLNAKGVVRDPNDDYLIAHAQSARANYLVTGDKDLLVLERIDNLLIVTPAEFMFLLEQDKA